MRMFRDSLWVGMFLMAGLAQGSGSVGTTSLNLGVGARSEGMGGAFVAVADDTSALYWNPGGLGLVANTRLSGTHTEWLGGVRYEWVGFAQPFGKYATAAVGVKILTGGDVVRTVVTGTGYQEAGTFQYGTRHLSFGVGSGRVGNLRFGGAIEIVREALSFSGAAAEELDARVTAVHLGGLYETPLPGFRVGGALRNLGDASPFGSVSSPLPRVFQVGAAYTLRLESETMEELPPELTTTELPKEKTTTGEVTFAADGLFLREESPALRVGIEYRFRNGFAVRAGYRTDGLFDVVSRLAGGLGYATESYEVDYSFLPMGDLGSVHRFSFTLFFR